MGELAEKRPCPTCGSTQWYGLKGLPEGGWACTECLDWHPTAPDVNHMKKVHRSMKSENTKFLKDTVPPHTYDKLTKKMVPNPEFVKAFPDQARQWYRPAELKKAGYGKLAETVQKKRDADGVSKDLGGSIKTD